MRAGGLFWFSLYFLVSPFLALLVYFLYALGCPLGVSFFILMYYIHLPIKKRIYEEQTKNRSSTFQLCEIYESLKLFCFSYKG